MSGGMVDVTPIPPQPDVNLASPHLDQPDRAELEAADRHVVGLAVERVRDRRHAALLQRPPDERRPLVGEPDGAQWNGV